jgi:oxygen-independent coproporphyrinogen-3 oxidase
MQSIRKGTVPFDKEVLSPQMALNEYIMISLRTQAGCSLERVSAQFGEDKSRQLLSAGAEFIEKGWMLQEASMLRLTREGKFFADGIAAAMFF